jgi:hypothetical protein
LVSELVGSTKRRHLNLNIVAVFERRKGASLYEYGIECVPQVALRGVSVGEQGNYVAPSELEA